MPGILPMKVIRVGTNTQSRIAQACDRCRSKKIRCDGTRPCCSQCASVGFECKTSDKLSRRAFPRGYTESLEDRVRSLETEVKELKDLLDGKEEKIDILSRIHSGSSPQRRCATPSKATPKEHRSSPGASKDDIFRVQQPPFLVGMKGSDKYFTGNSSTRAFVDTFNGKLQENGRPYSDLEIDVSYSSRPNESSSLKLSQKHGILASDQMVNIFFQEWAPLFPVLHRPSFLTLYNRYITDTESSMDPQSVAQLYLVFEIAALSTTGARQDVFDFEAQWQPALDSISSTNTLGTLQCLILVQILCMSKADYAKMLRNKGIAIGLSHRLGLHQSQKRFALGALTRETRKKVFWTQYTLDCFSAAMTGLPRLFKDSDICTELPSDVEDENVTEEGFLPTPPGESTRLSSALALFRLSQLVSKILDEIYPSTSSYDLSLQKLSAMNDELNDWLQNLAPHLRLEFVQDKPSTNVISSSSPLLSLAYHYSRSLIYRPVAASNLGPNSFPALVALASSSKCVIQIIQLLEERQMKFSICLNKHELLLLSGIGLLFQGVNLDRGGKLIRDSERLIYSTIEILEREHAYSAAKYKKAARAVMSLDQSATDAPVQSNSEITQTVSSDSMPESSAIRNQVQPIASGYSSNNSHAIKQEDGGRRLTLPLLAPNTATPPSHNESLPKLSPAKSLPILPSDGTIQAQSSAQRLITPTKLNLDYFPFDDDAFITSHVPLECLNKSTLSPRKSEAVELYGGTTATPYHAQCDLQTDRILELWSELQSDRLILDLPGNNYSVSISDGSLTGGEDFSGRGEARSERCEVKMPVLDNRGGFIGLNASFGI